MSNIEKDIRKINNLIERCKECKFATCEQCEINWTEVKAIAHILAEREEDKKKIEELEKKNREILNSKIGIDLSYDDYIPKQKVKDLKESIVLEPTIVGERRDAKTLEYGIKLGKIKACEELLEDK